MSYIHIARVAVDNAHKTLNLFDMATADQRPFNDYCKDIQDAFQEVVKRLYVDQRKTPEDGFEIWRSFLTKQGWTRGGMYDPIKKIHPALVASFNDLKDEEYIYMFTSIHWITNDMAYLLS